jgi:hypothetical protein
MAGLADILRNAVATIKTVTTDLQADITLERWEGQDVYGAPDYDDPENLKAIVDIREQQKRTETGQLVMLRALVILLQPLAANGAANRAEPIDPRDKITLPDGSTGPIVGSAGFIDPGTDKPYFHEIWIGYGSGNGQERA